MAEFATLPALRTLAAILAHLALALAVTLVEPLLAIAFAVAPFVIALLAVAFALVFRRGALSDEVS